MSVGIVSFLNEFLRMWQFAILCAISVFMPVGSQEGVEYRVLARLLHVS